MPIKVTCSCGAAFAAKDELAGKKVKCPKCQIPLEIPKPQNRPSAQQQQAAPRPAPQAQAADEILGLAPPEGNRQIVGDPFMNELLAEAGVMTDPNYRGPRCPGCNAPIQQNAVLCVKCGFDMRTGHRIRAEIGPSSEFAHLSHGANAEELIRKAEKEIAESPIQHDDSDQGDMLTAFLLTGGMIFVSVIAVGLGYLVFRWIDVSATSVTGIAVIIMMIGIPMEAIGRIWILVLAFMEDTIQGVLCLFVPCYILYWGFTHMATASIPTVLMVVGSLMGFASGIMFQIGDSEAEGVYFAPPTIERIEEAELALLQSARIADTFDRAAAAPPFRASRYPLSSREETQCVSPQPFSVAWLLAA